MNQEQAVEIAQHIHGWMSPEELGWLYDTARKFGGTWVEVGSWRGRSTFATAMGMPKKSHLICIDTFTGSDVKNPAHQHMRNNPGELYRAFLSTVTLIVQLRPDLRISVLCGDSSEMLQALSTADVVFIDGDHTYDAVLKDVRAAEGLEPTILSGHDFPRVKDALADVGLGKPNRGPGSIWWGKR